MMKSLISRKSNQLLENRFSQRLLAQLIKDARWVPEISLFKKMIHCFCESKNGFLSEQHEINDEQNQIFKNGDSNL